MLVGGLPTSPLDSTPQSVVPSDLVDRTVRCEGRNVDLLFLDEAALSEQRVDQHRDVAARLPHHQHALALVHHRALALEDTLDVDVFCPPREDWLAGTDAYLRR